MMPSSLSLKHCQYRSSKYYDGDSLILRRIISISMTVFPMGEIICKCEEICNQPNGVQPKRFHCNQNLTPASLQGGGGGGGGDSVMSSITGILSGVINYLQENNIRGLNGTQSGGRPDVVVLYDYTTCWPSACQVSGGPDEWPQYAAVHHNTPRHTLINGFGTFLQTAAGDFTEHE